MHTRILSLIILATGLMAGRPMAQAPSDPPKVRVGTYDSRAVAVAYAASEHLTVAGKQRELKEARAAGDKSKVAELEAWGRAQQRSLHRQGFGRVPVDDLLAHVAARLPEAAAQAGVEAIVFGCDWSGPGVEIVDVTDHVVALYSPSAKTLRVIAELRKQAPLDLSVLDEHEDDH